MHGRAHDTAPSAVVWYGESVFFRYCVAGPDAQAQPRMAPMKLYSANLSPFAARPRIAIYAKGLAVEILPPPGGPGSAAYKAINPTGKVPCLVTSGGQCIPESA